MNYNLHVQTKCWNKETNSLFDYETNDYTINDLAVHSNGNLYRWDKGLVFTEHKISMSSKFTYMSNIKQTKGSLINNKDNYIISFENEKTKDNPNKNFEEKIWVVIRHTYFSENIGWKIKVGDIIKLGKIAMRIKEAHIKNVNKEENFISGLEDLKKEECDKDYFKIKNNENMENIYDNKLILHTNKTRTKSDLSKRTYKKKTISPICRICLFDDNDLTNPLINPCKCSGSMKYIHLNCLKQWLNSRLITKKINHLLIYSFKSIECEICKVTIPERVKIKNLSYSLLGIERPNDMNYLVLESVFEKKSDNKNIYIFQFKDKQEIQIGRGNEVDIRITDISVSRCHAVIRIERQQFYLRDTYSKFGTLVQAQSEVMLLPNKKISLQIGKAFTSFIMKKTFLGYLNCCYRYNNLYNIKDYNGFFEIKWNFTKENVFHCDNASESIIEDEATQNEIINIGDKTDKTNEGNRMEMTDDYILKKNDINEKLFELRLRSDNIEIKEDVTINDKIKIKLNDLALGYRMKSTKAFQTSKSVIFKENNINEVEANIRSNLNFCSEKEKNTVDDVKDKEFMANLILSPNFNRENVSNNNTTKAIIMNMFCLNSSKENNQKIIIKSDQQKIDSNRIKENKIDEIVENKIIMNMARLNNDNNQISEHNQSSTLLKNPL